MQPDDSLRQFPQELRRWARRGTRASASEARSRVLNTLENRPAKTAGSVAVWPRWVTALAVIVLAIALGLLVPWDTREDKPLIMVSNPEVLSGERFLVVTLTSGNPLYIQLTPPEIRNP